MLITSTADHDVTAETKKEKKEQVLCVVGQSGMLLNILGCFNQGNWLPEVKKKQ